MNQFCNSFQQAQFILKYLRDELTIQEKNELETWLGANENTRILFEELTNEQLIKNELQFFDTIFTDAAWQKIEGRITAPAKLVSIKTNRRWWYVAAAVIFLVGAFPVYRFVLKQPSTTPPIAKRPTGKDDVAPGGNKAILTLADGSTIILDNAANGDLTSQGNTKVIKLDGQLAYTTDGATTEVVYNTISTPRGGQYQIILADGSKVWLNAASTLRYPTSFIGKERKVELTGEGYFEVAKNAAMSFKVNVDGKGEVEVLGTHFNINSYSDEEFVKTTLVEGKVKVAYAGTEAMLSPNQQAIFSRKNNTLSVDKDADVNKAIAWKNGFFEFDNYDIVSIMRQLSRWYDVDVQFVGNISAQFYSGSIPTQVNISQVLYMLEQAGGTEFKVKGKTVEVRTK